MGRKRCKYCEDNTPPTSMNYCPMCGRKLAKDEPVDDRSMMTNHEAADEIRDTLNFYNKMPRCNGKSMIPVMVKILALEKAIEVLERTPDD